MPKPFLETRRHVPSLSAVFLGVIALAAPALADDPLSVSPTAGYDRVLPLEGASNFRDMGGLYTSEGQRVRRGLLFRSGVMSALTDEDMDYLDQFGFQAIVDLRSTEERDLYPNHWASDREVPVIAHEYSMRDLLQGASTGGDASETGEGRSNAALSRGMHELYKTMPYMLEPQLKLFFSELVAGHTPLAVNCSAGQDRTGISTALLLISLGVPRDVVVQDYLNSTRFRRPVNERGDVDLVQAAQDNFAAAVMLRYSGGSNTVSPAKPLLTEDGEPFLSYALDQIEEDFGSIDAFLNERIEVDAEDLQRLRALYLESPFDS